MTSAENSSQPDTPRMSSGSIDSVNKQDPAAHSPELPLKPSQQKSLSGTQKPSYLPSILQGGTIADITKSVTDLVVNQDNPAAKEIVGRFFNNGARGFTASLPLICKGSRCCFYKICPIQQAKLELPLNLPCPVEHGLIQIWVNKHLDALGINDYTDPENSFDMDIIYELAGHELLKWRMGLHLSDKGNLVEERITSYSMEGEPIFEEICSPLLEHLETQSKICLKLKEALVATRKSQLEAGKELADPNIKTSNLANRARELVRIRQQQQKDNNIKDADFNVK